MNIKRYVGDGKFYKRLLVVALPIAIQNAITNFVGMLDNLMIGRLGTPEMTGVAVTNQLMLVFNLAVFGAISGAGIYGAQFFGSKNLKGFRDTFRFKLIIGSVVTLIAAAVFLTLGPALINRFLLGEGDPADAAASLACGKEYMMIMLAGLLPFALTQCYSGTLRETGQTVVPMAAGIGAVAVNLIFNYILIFGHFGAPRMGAAGAAVATVISRFAEFAAVALYTHFTPRKNPFIRGALRSLRVPAELAGGIIAKSMPMMFNETMFAAGFTALSRCYSARGLNVVAAININQTFWNVFSVAFISLGVSISIILGQQLGAGKTDTAGDTARKLTVFSVAVSILFAAAFFACSELIPRFYNTEEEVRRMAAVFIRIDAVLMPFDAYIHAAYFTMRSGGKMLMTVLFDSGFVWAVQVPLALLLTAFTGLSIYWIFTLSLGSILIKCVFGFLYVRKGTWVKNLVADK